MNWLLNRLREPSTGAGIALACVLAKSVPQLAPFVDVLDAVGALAATHAIATPERGA